MRTKKQIKEQILRRRAKMPVSVWREKSRSIEKQIMEHPKFQSADEIFLFMPIKQEPDLEAVMKEAWRLGKKTAIPRLEEGGMTFYYIHDLSQTVKGAYGIREPVGNEKAQGENVLMIMPGTAFDRYYNRIGYGGGYYDRYLQKHPHICTLAVCFSFQVLSGIPNEIHDIKPDILMTEYGVIRKEE